VPKALASIMRCRCTRALTMIAMHCARRVTVERLGLAGHTSNEVFHDKTPRS